MTDIRRKLGVQSFCFRNFKDNNKVVELVKACGLNRIEICGVHVDFSDESTVDGVLEIYRNGGVEIVSIGVQAMKGDAASEEKYFQFAQRAGCRFMSVNFAVDSVPESLQIADQLAEKFDIRLAIHNHGGKHWLGNSQMMGKVFSMTSERIGLCLDTAWALDAGESPLKWIEKFGSRLYGVHIKDFIFDRARKPEDVVVGSGNLDLSQLRSTLEQVNFGGYAVLEYEGDVENPVPALQKCVEAVRNA